ncbi:MAG: energy transducer TonB [Bacteriovoracia bacterium]
MMTALWGSARNPSLSFALHALIIAAGLVRFSWGPQLDLSPGVAGVEVELVAGFTAPEPAPPASVSDIAVSQPKRKPRPAAAESTGTDRIDVRAGSGAITEAKPNYRRNPAPPYPERARFLRQQGLVVLTVSVDRQGAVKSLALAKSSGYPLLDRAALMAVRGWEFQPAQLGHVSVEATVSVPVRFELAGGVATESAVSAVSL